MNLMANMVQSEAKAIGKPEFRSVKNLEARMKQLTRDYDPSLKATSHDVQPFLTEVDIDGDQPLTDCMASNPVKVNNGFPSSYDANWMPTPHQPAKMTNSLLAHQ